MDCFNHPDRSAVGICKSCGRGLCHDCAVDSPNGLSCKGCESRVRLMNQIVDSNARVLSVARSQARFGASLLILIGVVMLVLALWSQILSGDVLVIVLFGLLGIFVIIEGLRRLSPRAQYPRIDNPSEPAGRGPSWS